MLPKFSIIIPVYNVAPYLRECLDSVLAQTVNDPASPCYAAASWEVICVDDGSTDGSGVILDEYAAKDSRFRVVHQPNGGVSAARNAGLDVAQGEWVGFVDPDDVWDRRLLALVNDRSRNDVDIVAYGYKVVNKELNDYPWSKKELNSFTATGEEVLLRNEMPCSSSLLESVCDKFVRRGIIDDYKLRLVRGIIFNEDNLFAIMCMRFARNVDFIGEQLYIYRSTPGSAVKRNPWGKLMSTIDVYYALYDFAKKYPSKGLTKALCRRGVRLFFPDGCQEDVQERRLYFDTLKTNPRFGCDVRGLLIRKGSIKQKGVSLLSFFWL